MGDATADLQDGAVVLLLRHGRTAWNRQRRFLGRTDVPLDPHGLRQAKAVAHHLRHVPLSAVVTSPLARAADTASCITAQRDLICVTDQRLMELSQGDLEGQPSHTLADRYPDFLGRWRTDPGSARVPGGETLGECQNRGVDALLDACALASPGRPVVVVTHQMVIASVLCKLNGLPLRMYRLLTHDNAAYSRLCVHHGRLEVDHFHQRAHLGPQV